MSFFHPLPWSNAYPWCWAILFVYNRRIDYVLASILFACVFYWWTEVIVININEEWWLTPCMLSLFLLLVVMLRCVCVCFPFFATLFTIYYYLLFTISVFMCIINLLWLDSSFFFFPFLKNFFRYFLPLHFKCYPLSKFPLRKSPIPSQALLPKPPTPASWPCHSPVLEHIIFTRQNGLSSHSPPCSPTDPLPLPGPGITLYWGIWSPQCQGPLLPLMAN